MSAGRYSCGVVAEGMTNSRQLHLEHSSVKSSHRVSFQDRKLGNQGAAREDLHVTIKLLKGNSGGFQGAQFPNLDI